MLTDFRNVLFLVWQHLKLPDPTPIQYEIAHWLQHGPNREIIEAFRGAGKSWITSAFALFVLLHDPQKKVLVVSASKQRADDFSTFTLRLINEVPIFQHLRPKEDQRNSKLSFDVGPARAAHAPSVTSKGIFSQLSGSRANLIIADDVEVPNNSGTEDLRDKLINACLEFEAILVPGGRIVFLGTPQTEESIYNKLGERGYPMRIWPSRVPQEKKVEGYKGRLAPSIQKLVDERKFNIPTDPLRFNEVVLMEREGIYGRSGFSLQFMLDTELSDIERYPLKLSDLIVVNANTEQAPVLIQYGSHRDQLLNLPNVGFTGDRLYGPMYADKQWKPYESSVMAIDPSGRGADETGFAVVKLLHGYLWVTRCGGFKGGYEDTTLELLASIALQEKVNQVIIEDNFGDGMFAKLFQPVLNRFHPAAIEGIRAKGQKEARIIDTLEPLMNRHKLIVDLDLLKRDIELAQTDGKHYSLCYQLTRLTRDRGALRHDDRIDALAMACGFFVDAVARDELKARDQYEMQMLEEELRRFQDHVMGRDQRTSRGGFLSGAKQGPLRSPDRPMGSKR